MGCPFDMRPNDSGGAAQPGIKVERQVELMRRTGQERIEGGRIGRDTDPAILFIELIETQVPRGTTSQVERGIILYQGKHGISSGVGSCLVLLLGRVPAEHQEDLCIVLDQFVPDRVGTVSARPGSIGIVRRTKTRPLKQMGRKDRGHSRMRVDDTLRPGDDVVRYIRLQV